MPHAPIFLCLIVVLTGLAGCRSADYPGPTDEADDASATITFTPVTEEAGLSAFRHVNGARGAKWFPETMGSGAAFIDVDGDGWQDILLVGGGVWTEDERENLRSLWLFRNRGDGTFEDRTVESGLHVFKDYGMGLTVADYDNDGDSDVYFTTVRENRLLRNDDGVFIDVAGSAGVAGDPVWSTAAVFFDANRDGLADLFVGNYVVWSPNEDLWCSTDGTSKMYCAPQIYEGVEGRFYEGRPGGQFVDRTRESGLVAIGKTLGAVAFDFNSDGLPDLMVTNDTNPDQLFENLGDGTFRDVGVLSGVAFDEHGMARAGMGVDAGAISPGGGVSVAVGNFSNEMIGLYTYIGNGVFVDRAASSRIGRRSLNTLTFGLFFFDVDLDGDLDLFAANGHIDADIEKVRDNTTFRQPTHLFINDGHGHFEDIAPTLPDTFGKALVARGAAYADYDNDGDIDVLVTENIGPAYLWRNDTVRPGSWVRVALSGVEGTCDALGANVTLWWQESEQTRHVRSGFSYLSSSEMALTFGRASTQPADSIVVRWASGTRQRVTEVPLNGTVKIREPARSHGGRCEGSRDSRRVSELR